MDAMTIWAQVVAQGAAIAADPGGFFAPYYEAMREALLGLLRAHGWPV